MKPGRKLTFEEALLVTTAKHRELFRRLASRDTNEQIAKSILADPKLLDKAKANCLRLTGRETL